MKKHDSSADEIADLQRKTEEIEAEKNARKLERERKRLEKIAAKRRANQERAVAPILLLITIVIGVLLLIFR